MDNFILEKQIGSGTRSIVYKATNRETGEIVAIKKAKIKFKQELEHEYLLMSNFNFPNLVKFHEYCEDFISSYIVMEYCEQDLLEFANNNIINENKAKDIFYQICLGIGFLHQNKIAHCDLKLENILICKNKIKLADFGFSENFNENKKEYIKGSLQYLAPEAFISIPTRACTLDIWSLGIILHALLSKRFPIRLRDDRLQDNLIEYLKIGIQGIKIDNIYCQDLLSKTLEISIEKRITIQNILSHSWFLKLDLSDLKPNVVKVATPTETEYSV